jgi:opacity protein-like surface antigen
MPRAHLLTSIAAALLLASPVAAQHITSPYRYLDLPQSVTLFGGALKTQTGSAKLGPEAGNIFGGRWAYRASGPLQVELSLGYAPLNRVVRDTVRTSAKDSTFRSAGTIAQRVVVAMAGLRFDVTGARTWHGFQPYIVAGVGAAIGSSASGGPAVPADAKFKFGTSFAVQAGGGIEWYAARHVGLLVDARGMLWKLHTPSAFHLADAKLPASEWAQNAALSAGLAVHF